MSVIRTTRKTNFTIVPNKALRDPNLSWGAKGLLACMLSFPNDWKYSLAHLAKINAQGLHATRTAFQQLEAAGYVTRHNAHDETGRFSGYEYTVSDQPTVVRFSDDGKTDDGKPHATKTEVTKTEVTNTPLPSSSAVHHYARDTAEDEAEEAIARQNGKLARQHDHHVLMSHHPEVWQRLGELTTTYGWKTPQHRKVAQRLLELTRDHTPGKVTAAIDKVLMNAHHVKWPVALIEKILAEDARTNTTGDPSPLHSDEELDRMFGLN